MGQQPLHVYKKWIRRRIWAATLALLTSLMNLKVKATEGRHSCFNLPFASVAVPGRACCLHEHLPATSAPPLPCAVPIASTTALWAHLLPA